MGLIAILIADEVAGERTELTDSDAEDKAQMAACVFGFGEISQRPRRPDRARLRRSREDR